MTRICMTVIGAACAAALLTGCSVRVNAGGHSTGVEVKVPDVSINVSGNEAGNPGSVPVNLSIPADSKSVEINLGLALGEVKVDNGGAGSVSGQIGYWRIAPSVTGRQSGERFVVDVPAETVHTIKRSVPDTVLHAGSKSPLLLRIGSAVGNVTIDLRDADVSEFRMGAAVGKVEVRVRRDANVRLHYKVGIGGNNLRDQGFVQSGDVWLSPGFKEENVVEMSVEAGVGELRIVR